MKMKKLSICKNTKIKTYNHSAVCIGLLEENDISYDSWLCNHFLQLYWKPSWGAISLNRVAMFFYDGFIWRLKLVFSFSKRNSQKFLNKIINAIDEGYCICFMVNERYIPNKFYYQRKNYLHDLYIIGYDLEKEELYTYGYNKDFKLCETVISFSDLLAGITSYFVYPMVLFKPNREHLNKPICTRKVISALNKLRIQRYGFGRKSPLIKVVDKIKKGNSGWIDMRDFSVICEQSYILSKVNEILCLDCNDIIDLLALRAKAIYFKALQCRVNTNNERCANLIKELMNYMEELDDVASHMRSKLKSKKKKAL